MTLCVDERLFFRVLPGERRGELRREDAALAYAVSELPGECTHGVVLLIHGLASNASRWEEFSETTALAAERTLVRFDLRGHGASVARGRATLETHAGDAAALLDVLGARKALLIGHSLGAQVAMRFASMWPERVEGLVLLDPLISSALTEAAERKRRLRPVLCLIEALGRLANALGIRRRRRAHSLRREDERARRMIAAGGKAYREFLREYASPTADLSHIGVADFARALLEVGRPEPDLQELRAPVLVLGAEKGAYTDSGRLSAWAQTLRDATSETVRCHHWPLTECPDEVRQWIEGWVGERFGR